MSESAPSEFASTTNAERREVMALLAEADPETLANGWNALAARPPYSVVRAPETGLVMVRGRIGGSGQPFNLGETTVTRCVVALSTGEAGYSYCLGRDKTRALFAALFDAMWQREDTRHAIEGTVIAPLRQADAQRRTVRRAETAATKVDFFTMVRGED